jgi:signal transduction histidine kinase
MACQLRTRPVPGRRSAVALGALALASIGALGLNAPWMYVVMAMAVCQTAAMIRVGLVFLRELPPADVAAGARWVGWSAIALALWPFVYPYPLLVHTSWAWLGYAGSGMLGMSLGLAMALYMVEVSWQRFKQAQDQLAQVKNDFVSVVSHELRSPLTAAIGYAEFLDEELAGPLNEAQREYLEEIQKGHRRLRRLVDDLLDFSLAESRALKLARRDTDLAPLVHSVIESHRPQAQRVGVQLEAEGAEGPVRTSVDPERLEQVVTNLLGNALKFTPEGGRVRVALRSTADQALLEVHDTGMGIEPADLPHLFDKFFQAGAGPRRVRGGAGVGLAVAKAIVEAHDGTIRVDSRPGEGTRFMITLPLSTAGGAPLEAACTADDLAS